MPASVWMRRWRSVYAADDCANVIIHAAARGDSLDQMLDLGTQALLSAGTADRAGLWLSGERRGESPRGRVMEAATTPIPIPEQWKHLDISTPFLRAALESTEPLHVEFVTEAAMPRLGPLMGMRSAVWIPIRTRNCIYGLAMVAYSNRHSGVQLELGRLKSRADEVALAIAHHHDTRRSELAAEGLRSQARLSRAILSNVSLDSILPQIARAARVHVQAEFIAVGRVDGLSIRAESWDGPEAWRSLLQQKTILEMWQQVLDQGSYAEISGEAIAEVLNSASDHAMPTLDRVIVVPIEVQNRVCGLLMAGLLPSGDSSNDIVQMESYSLLVASALNQEATRGGRAEMVSSLDRIVEDSSEYLLVMDEDGIVRNASRSARTFLGFDVEHLDVMLLEDFFQPVARDAITEWRSRVSKRRRATDDESRMVPIEAALSGGAVVRLHMRTMLEARLHETKRWLIYVDDYGSRKALQDAEGRVEAEMLGLMDSIDSGVLLLDAAGKILVVSDRLAQIMGVEARRLFELGTIDALIDSIANRFSHPSETAMRWRERARRGDEACWDEIELLRPTRKIVERFARPLLNTDGSRVGWLEVYRDITSQRLIQSKLMQTEKMAALGQLVSGIAHELSNPLTSIQGYAQLLLSRHSAADRTADAQRISAEAARAGRIVKNLLLFSRETKPERRPVNLNEVIERTVALRAYELKIENILMELTLDASLPNTMADAAQLQQVVLNLIINAEQAIQEGRGQGSGPNRIAIRTRRLADNRVGMDVSDDGPGISPDVISRLFDPFFTTKPVGVGTGLGLSIAYGIVQEHGGEIIVESQTGHGACLTVELPTLSAPTLDFTEDDPSKARRAVSIVPVPHAVRAGPRVERILVVEDEPTVAELIADVMSEEGYPVETLLDSREALGRLKKKNYDLVICDLKMPNLDGPSLYRALVSTGSPVQHKLLFVTGDTMSPRTLEFLNSNGLPYLAKPFLVEELKESVRRAIAATPPDEAVVVGPAWERSTAREK